MIIYSVYYIQTFYKVFMNDVYFHFFLYICHQCMNVNTEQIANILNFHKVHSWQLLLFLICPCLIISFHHHPPPLLPLPSPLLLQLPLVGHSWGRSPPPQLDPQPRWFLGRWGIPPELVRSVGDCSCPCCICDHSQYRHSQIFWKKLYSRMNGEFLWYTWGNVSNIQILYCFFFLQIL